MGKKVSKCDNCGKRKEIHPLMGFCYECTQLILDEDANEAVRKAQYFRQGKLK